MPSHRLHARCAHASAPRPFVLPGTERQYERSRPFELLHVALDLELDFSAKAVSGSATLEFRRIDPEATCLRLDAVAFELAEVTLLGAEVPSENEFEYDGAELLITIPRAVTRGSVLVRYRAVPRQGLYFLAPDAEVPDRPVQVWTQCQDEYARHWLPCHDKPHVKMTSELRVSVPAGFAALSNGELVGKDTTAPAAKPKRSKKPAKGTPPAGLDGARWSYHYRLEQPHPSYLLTLVVGRFAILRDRDAELPSGRLVPIEYWVPEGREQDGWRAFQQTPHMVELFSELTGVEYPWSRYTQIVVSDFIFGGMENTTATTMYEHVLVDERAALDIPSEDLVAHELAHQWFGDHVTCRDWSEAWLNEGFATFFEQLEREDRLGRDAYEWGVGVDLATYLGEARGRYQRPIVSKDWETPIDLFDRHLYEKGGLVLHMLRRELGDELFWAGIRQYLQALGGGLAETRELQRSLEAVSGRSLARFFDQWVHSSGHPEIGVRLSWDDGLLTARVEQRPSDASGRPFAFSFEIEIVDARGAKVRSRKRVTALDDALTVRLPRRPQHVAVDPEFLLAAPIKLDAPEDWLRDQLATGSSARVRCAAAGALSKRNTVTSIGSLGTALADPDQPWMTRAAAARALGRLRASDARDWLLRHIDDPEPKVRRAVVSALGEYRSRPVAVALSRFARHDPSYLVQAEALRSLGATRDAEGRSVLEAALGQPAWNDVITAGSLDGLAAGRHREALSEVKRRTQYGHPSRGRRAAVAALPKLSDSRETREHLEELLRDSDPHFRIAVIDALVDLGDERVRHALELQVQHEDDGRVARRLREALGQLSKPVNDDLKRVSDELDSLRRELIELKLRVDKGVSASAGRGGGEPTHSPSTGTKGRADTKPERMAGGPKKAATKKAATKKAATKKAATKKAATKKAATKRAATKKASANKRTGQRRGR